MGGVDARVDDRDHRAGAVVALRPRLVRADQRDALGEHGPVQPVLGHALDQRARRQLAQAVSRDLLAPLRWPFVARVATYCMLVFAIVLIGEDFGAPFIYFQF